ncbi:MAG TPA: hypothetical protein VMQ93_04850 [Novosphingobium sp.]|nr:hypothetical protein [Novosphingobium sp.]
MLKHADPILKLALALAALLAGAGVGYYYGIYLPAQDVRRQTQAMAERQAQSQAEAKALAARARREQAAQVEYEDCANFAELSYKQRWNLSCQGLHDADQSAFDDCADDLFATESGCLAKIPIRPAQGCALPAQVAQSLSQARDDRKAQCLARLEAVQQGRGQPMDEPSGLN